MRHDDRDFATDVELSRAAADGNDVRLGQNLGDVVLLQPIEEAEERVVVVNDAELGGFAGGVDDRLNAADAVARVGQAGR